MKTDRALQVWFWLCIVISVAGFLSIGCVPAQAIKQAQTEQVLNEAHAKDATLPREAREIGRVNWWAWSAQRYSLDGTRLPEEVEAAMRAAGKLPEGYDQ